MEEFYTSITRLIDFYVVWCLVSKTIRQDQKFEAGQIIIVLDLDQIYRMSQTYRSRICRDLSVTNPYTTYNTRIKI